MAAKLKSLKRKSTVDQVVDQIRSFIDQRKLKSGARLPGEYEMVDQLQVSRPVLREALARLQSQGLVEIKRGRGTFVADGTSLAGCVQLLRSAVTITPKELLQYTELRMAIEIQAIRQAAERATEEQIAELEELLEQVNSETRPYAEVLELDFKFHRKIIEVGGNELMQNLMEVIYDFVVAQMALTTPSPEQNKLGRSQHEQMVAAIRNRDSDAAESAIRQHMQIVIDRLLK